MSKSLFVNITLQFEKVLTCFVFCDSNFRISEVSILLRYAMSSSQQDSSDEETELPDFSIVHFIKRGRQPKTRQVDIVPSKWLDSKGKGRFCTRFPELSSDQDDSEFLHGFVKSCADPPEAWKTYTVAVLGQASAYLNKDFIAGPFYVLLSRLLL